MQKILFSLIIFSCLMQGILSIQAQNSGGREFWLTFGKHRVLQPIQLNDLDMQIRIVGGSQVTAVTIYFTNLGTPPIVYNIAPYEVSDYPLTLPQKEAVYNTVTGKTNNSIHIVTSSPVSVYALNSVTAFTEVTNVLPVSALGTEYYQISYTEPGIYLDAYAVVATQNNTTLFHNGTPIETLNTGEVYYRTSTDMTGNFVTSNKPIAFFAVHQGTGIPYGDNTYCQLMQQLAPKNTWGKTFFVPVTKMESEIVRIVASTNSTNITQLVGGTIRTGVPGAKTYLTNLQAGDFVELDITANGCFIVADNPVGVCSFMKRLANVSFTFSSIPSQTWVPGLEQTVPSAFVAPFISTKPTNRIHYALVVTSTDTRDNTLVSIGGAAPQALTGDTWKDNPAAGMSFYSFELSNTTASYNFTNSDGVIIFGYSVGINSLPSSYYYLAYSAMRDLQATFYANDIPYQLLKENDFCEEDVHFLAEIEGLHPSHPDRITWWINGTEYLPAKTLEEWYKPFTVGEYEIRMDVIYETLETASKTGTLIIKSCNQSAAFFANNVLHTELKDTTFCNKNVNFRAEIEGLHPTDPEKIKWYVDSKDGNGFIEEISALNQTEWGRPFENGTYEIKLVVHYDNDTYATLAGTLKVQALWIKIRNVRY